jgi:hypothetical protein
LIKSRIEFRLQSHANENVTEVDALMWANKAFQIFFYMLLTFIICVIYILMIFLILNFKAFNEFSKNIGVLLEVKETRP